MTNKFFKQGDRYVVASNDAMHIMDKLPPLTYTVRYNQDADSYYLQAIDNFTIGKIYGNATKNADRIMNTFESRKAATGALLLGEKGSGKTLLAKVLSVMGREKGYPTIVVNQPHHGDNFNRFMQLIEQPAIVLFDEFEKVYSGVDQAGDRVSSQENMLTLLDGSYPSKKLYILTCNNKYVIDSNMKNRPGRLFYNIEYHGIEIELVREYCADNLKDMSQAEGIEKIVQVFHNFNFDMLKALVEEMNRYNSSAAEIIDIMNIKIEDTSGSFDVEVWVDGIKANDAILSGGTNLAHGLTVYYTLQEPTLKNAVANMMTSKKSVIPESIDFYINPAPPISKYGKKQRYGVNIGFLFSVNDMKHIEDGGAIVYERDGVKALLKPKRDKYNNPLSKVF